MNKAEILKKIAKIIIAAVDIATENTAKLI